VTTTTILDNAFNADTEEGTPPRELLPAGKYKADITSATCAPTKNGRGQMVSLTWTIAEGDYQNRLVFQGILVQHDSEDAQRFGRQKFKDVCVACNVTGEITDLSVLLYTTCVISVIIRKDKDGQYPDKNEVARVMPVISWNGSKPAAQVLKEASSTPKSFDAVDKKFDDEIGF
jgi:Protein of unknown function (DUF669)